MHREQGQPSPLPTLKKKNPKAGPAGLIGVGKDCRHHITLQYRRRAKFWRTVGGVKRPTVSQGYIWLILLCLAIRGRAHRIKATAGNPETKPGTKLWLYRPSSKISPTHRVFSHHGNTKVLHNLKDSPNGSLLPFPGNQPSVSRSLPRSTIRIGTSHPLS